MEEIMKVFLFVLIGVPSILIYLGIIDSYYINKKEKSIDNLMEKELKEEQESDKEINEIKWINWNTFDDDIRKQSDATRPKCSNCYRPVYGIYDEKLNMCLTCSLRFKDIMSDSEKLQLKRDKILEEILK